jgi:hypothetical protein
MAAAGKMAALQSASKNLITKLQNASVVNTNAYVSIVPFARRSVSRCLRSGPCFPI